jgi:hypothetical protein
VGAAGAAVLVTTYFLGVKSGLSAWLSLIPPSLLAVDSVFLRAALVGRMDMLALVLILCALLVATHASPSTGSPTPRTTFLVLLLCQSLLLPVIGTELWYPIYLLPLAALGVTHLARHTELKQSPRLISGLAAVILVTCYVHGNISRLSRMRAALDRGDADYRAWRPQVSALIPHIQGPAVGDSRSLLRFAEPPRPAAPGVSS